MEESLIENKSQKECKKKKKKSKAETSYIVVIVDDGGADSPNANSRAVMPRLQISVFSLTPAS
jgi:hypothetical protein